MEGAKKAASAPVSDREFAMYAAVYEETAYALQTASEAMVIGRRA